MRWDETAYGEAAAEIYDELYEHRLDVAGSIDFLVERARGGPALELAIGTGRIAIPLRNMGVEVSGIDISEEMVARLRSKRGGEDIPVTMGDFADVAVPGRFALVFVVFNTLFALTTQEDQLRCFRNVAAHLTDDGSFVIEAFVPDTTRFRRHQNTEVVDVELERVILDVSRHDPTNQTILAHHVILDEKGAKLIPIKLRYAWPAEMDLMAKLAGLELRERYANWRREPFTSESKSHLSVYGRA